MAGGGGEQEINLVPYLDIMINLIMFMLTVTAYLVELKEAPVLAPAYGGGGGGGVQKVFLSVSVASDKLAILASGGGLAGQEFLKNAKGEYPYKDLTVALRTYKETYPDLSENLVVFGDAKIPYRAIVSTMDAARGDAKHPLFPGITLSIAVGGK